MDTPETLALDMLKAAATATGSAKIAVQKGAYNVKRDAQRNSAASSGFSASGASFSIGYRTEVRANSFVAVVGYGEGLNANRQAALGTLLEYGGGRDHSPPHRDLGRALESEEPRFLEAIGDSAYGGLIGRGRR